MGPSVSWAECVSNGVPQIGCLFVLYQIAFNTALSLIGIVSLFMIILAGIKYITSGGGKQVEEAKNILTYAIIGFLIVLLAVFITRLLGDITGITCLDVFSFTSCTR